VRCTTGILALCVGKEFAAADIHGFLLSTNEAKDHASTN
jgi:hypothetical protein